MSTFLDELSQEGRLLYLLLGSLEKGLLSNSSQGGPKGNRKRGVEFNTSTY